MADKVVFIPDSIIREYENRIGLKMIVGYLFKMFKKFQFNSYAGDMAVARPYGFEIDFVRNPISESAAIFFVIILEFIFTPIS